MGTDNQFAGQSVERLADLGERTCCEGASGVNVSPSGTPRIGVLRRI